MGFVWPRWVIQPVPVYSQYMSISPDSSALRAATVPARPIWSFTVAPAFSRTCSVIWPRINCSVNSLEPLAAPGRPHQDHDLTLVDLHREIVHRRFALGGEDLREVLQADHGLRGLRIFLFRSFFSHGYPSKSSACPAH